MSAGVCSSSGEAGGACWVVNVRSVGVMSTRPLIILYIKVALRTVLLSRRVFSCSLFTSSVALM